MGKIVFDYVPREQFIGFHQRRERFGALVAHRRAGKTVAAVNELVLRALQSKKKNPRYGYIAPFRQQAKNIAWVYLKDATRSFATRIRESDLRIELPNGAWVSLYGADNPDSLRGVYFDGVILDEFGDCRPTLWAEVIVPTLADRKGWGIVMGTPRGENQFYDFFKLSKIDPDWFSLELKASETGILSPEELARMKKVMSDAQYEQELECSFSAPVLGTYYAGIIETLEKSGHIAPAVGRYDPAFPVNVATDLGYTDSCSWWFWQHRPDGIAIIRYYENQSQPLQHYFDMLDNTGYELETLYLPHDAKAKTLQTGRSTVEQFIDKYKDTTVKIDVVPLLKKQHGIDSARLVLPMCWFDLDETKLGIEALRTYRRKYDPVRKVFSNEPLHDWSSNGADAFRYLSLVCKDTLKIELPRQVLNRVAPITPALKPPQYKLAELFEDRDRFLSRRRHRI
jgi:hypothetical protein